MNVSVFYSFEEMRTDNAFRMTKVMPDCDSLEENLDAIRKAVDACQDYDDASCQTIEDAKNKVIEMAHQIDALREILENIQDPQL